MGFKIAGTTVLTNDRLVRLNSGADGSRPASPAVGTLFYNTTSGKLEVYNGAAWKAGVRIAPVEIPSMWTWGYNGNGQLGDNATTSHRSSPISVVTTTTIWSQVTGGYRHSLAVRANGTLWAWGDSTNGALGNNFGAADSTTAFLAPVQVVGGFTDWAQASCGRFHSLGLRGNGIAMAWGMNRTGLQAFGQLGTNDDVNRSSPVSVVGGFTDWIQLSAGGIHSVGIRANGSAWSWGYNQQGQLGINNAASRSSPVSVVGGFTDWIQISGANSGYHTCAVRANGSAWSWGMNIGGQLGNADTVYRSSPVSVVGGFSDWVQVSAGSRFSIGLRANGSLWAWGRNGYGQLGNADTVYRSSPVSVVGGFSDWTQVSAGLFHAAAVRANGTIWTWGNNNEGRLGINLAGSSAHRSSPVSVLGSYTDWVQVGAGRHTIGLRSQPVTQTTRPGNQRNRF